MLLLVLYVPTAGLLIGASNIAFPWTTIVYAVILFIVAPLVISACIRAYVVSTYGEEFLTERIVKPFKPVTIVALLLTLVVIFIFQGTNIGNKPLQIVLIAIPICIQCVLNWAICYYCGYMSCIPHSRLAPASMIATSNFFELAVAVAISVYGLDSGAALATVVGVLVEVPVMLALASACNRLKPRLDSRCDSCEEVCDWSNQMSKPCAYRKLRNNDDSCNTNNNNSTSNEECTGVECTSDVHFNEPFVKNKQTSVTIYHNPECETSCNVLEYLREARLDVVVVEYLQVGWTRDQLNQLFTYNPEWISEFHKNKSNEKNFTNTIIYDINFNVVWTNQCVS
jgi:hypothetical protein